MTGANTTNVFVNVYPQTNVQPQEFSGEPEEGSVPLACISSSEAPNLLFGQLHSMCENGLEPCEANRSTQNYLSKQGEWKCINLNVNFTTQLKNTMVRKRFDLYKKPHTGAGGGNKGECLGFGWLYIKQSP